MGVVRLALAALLALQPVVQAAELSPVDILLTRAIPQDEAALATSGPEKGERLVILQSDLALVVEGLEGFASEADAGPSLKRLQESVDAPEQFKDRAAALDAVYRALAVVDYTWAKRLPDAPCSPDSSRAALLKSGALSSWISSLLGVDGDAAAALDRASAATQASAREYALLRAKVRRLSDALGSEKAVGAIRASLYCRRADAYEALSAANRTSGLTAASRATGDEDVTGVYVLARPSKTGWEILGAATAIDGAIVTDARLVDSEGLALLRHDGKKPIPVTVERRDSGLALLRATEPVKGLSLADSAPAKDDLIETLGHPERTGAWTRTRGLVTSADAFSFQSDAVVDVGMAGGAALTEDGKLAGVFVLRRAQSGDKAFDWPVAVSAPALKSWLAGGALTAPSGSVEITEAGTASILTALRPMGGGTLASSNTVWINRNEFYQDGVRAVCAANCDDPAPAPAPRARSRTRYTNPRSSYSSGSNANAELGKALGEAIAPLVEAMIFKGIPALFRGIGSLFKSKPGATTPRRESVQEHPREIEKPPEPPKITGLTLTISPDEGLEGETLTARAEVSFSGDKPKKAGISVVFTDDANGKIVFPNNQASYSVPTDASGKVTITFELSAKERDLQQPFDDLKDEERRRAGELVPSRVRPDRKPKTAFEKVKQRAPDAFDSLDNEEEKTQAEKLSAGLSNASESEAKSYSDLTNAAVVFGPTPAPHIMPLTDAPVPFSHIATVNLTAAAASGAMGSAKGTAEVKVISGECPPGTSADPPESAQPGQPPMGSHHKARLEEMCRPFELEAEKACGNNQTCRDAKLLNLGYDFRACVTRWDTDGSGSVGSLGTPPPSKPNKRPLRCVRKSQSGGQAQTRALTPYAQESGHAGGSSDEDVVPAGGVHKQILSPWLEKLTGIVQLLFTRDKMQHEFKHAGDFGVSGTGTNQALSAYQKAIIAHIKSVSKPIRGTYRGNPVFHFFDAKTGKNIMVDTHGNFVGGWRLSDRQVFHVTSSGNLGGGP